MKKISGRYHYFKSVHITTTQHLKKFTIVLTAIALSACASFDHKPLPDDVSAHLAGKKIAVTTYAKRDFIPATAGTAAFALVGAAVMQVQGHALTKEYALEDPALQISHGLAEKLQRERGVVLLPDQNIVSDNDDVQELVSSHAGADYLLDVKTYGWGFIYYPTDWTHYKIMYQARVRLIDSAAKTVVAEVGCNSTEGDDNNPPSKDELLNHNATLLKAYLAKAASGCDTVASRDILKLSFKQNPAGPGVASRSDQAVPLMLGPGISSQPTTAPAVAGTSKKRQAGTAAADVNADTPEWHGLMACEARTVAGQIRPAYRAKFAVEVSPTAVTVHRETAMVVESLSGRVNDGMLDLRGNGHRVDSPEKEWQFKINGEFPGDAKQFSGKGGMYAGRKEIRACELTMRHS